MDNQNLLNLLYKVQNGSVSAEEAAKELKTLPFKNLDFAKVDTHRRIRQGFSEAVYSPGKSPEQIAKIMCELHKNASIILATKAENEQAQKVLDILPEAIYDPEAQIIMYGKFPEQKKENYAMVITAGTTDIPIAKEALITLKSNGIKTKELFDCGIAAIHRIFEHIETIQKAKAIITIAGMEGALASFIGGISCSPVIAVPTSNGYGSHFNGLAALLSMLNSCTSCVSVVNINNGYSAGIIASLIVNQSN